MRGNRALHSRPLMPPALENGRGWAGAGAGAGKRWQRESSGAPLSGAHPVDLSFRTEQQHQHIKFKISIRSNHLHAL